MDNMLLLLPNGSEIINTNGSQSHEVKGRKYI